MADGVGRAHPNNYKEMERQTALQRPIESKGLSGALANRVSRLRANENPVSAATLNGAISDSEVGLNSHDRYHKPAGASTAHELRDIARAVRRIHDPLRSNPERVLIAKDEIAHRLIGIAAAMEGAHVLR